MLKSRESQDVRGVKVFNTLSVLGF